MPSTVPATNPNPAAPPHDDGFAALIAGLTGKGIAGGPAPLEDTVCVPGVQGDGASAGVKESVANPKPASHKESKLREDSPTSEGNPATTAAIAIAPPVPQPDNLSDPTLVTGAVGATASVGATDSVNSTETPPSGTSTNAREASPCFGETGAIAALLASSAGNAESVASEPEIGRSSLSAASTEEQNEVPKSMPASAHDAAEAERALAATEGAPAQASAVAKGDRSVWMRAASEEAGKETKGTARVSREEPASMIAAAQAETSLKSDLPKSAADGLPAATATASETSFSANPMAAAKVSGQTRSPEPAASGHTPSRSRPAGTGEGQDPQLAAVPNAGLFAHSSEGITVAQPIHADRGVESTADRVLPPEPPSASAVQPREILRDAAPAQEVAAAGSNARIVDHLDHSEMFVGLRTAAFGSVEVHAIVQNSQVGLSIASERGDLRHYLTNEMPALAGRLEQHDLRLNEVAFGSTSTQFQGGTSSGSDPHSRGSPPPHPGRWELPSLTPEDRSALERIQKTESDRALNVRV